MTKRRQRQQTRDATAREIEYVKSCVAVCVATLINPHGADRTYLSHVERRLTWWREHLTNLEAELERLQQAESR